MLVHEYLTESAARFPDKTALILGDNQYTYRQVLEAATSVSSYLLEAGLTRGDRVMISLENSFEAVTAIFGTLLAGGCFVAVHSTTPTERLVYLLRNSGARVLILPSSKADDPDIVEESTQHDVKIIVVGSDRLNPEQIAWASLLKGDSAVEPVKAINLDLAAIIYTSGSTGKPKGVTLTHLNIETVASSVQEYLGNTEEDRILCVLQLSFGYGLLQLLVTFRSGGTLVLEKGYGYPYEVIKQIKAHRITGLAGTPTIFSILLQLSNLDQVDFSHLRYLTNAAAAIPQSFVPKLQKCFPGTSIYLMHGLTEVLRTTFLPPEELTRRPSSVGRGMKNVELWIEDPDGRRLGPGEVGELVVRGANVMQGYWDDPEGTSKVLLPGRYPGERVMHTGDLFSMDEEGFFYFHARMDDIIKSKGQKVSPLEVEHVLYAFEPVLECRVIGVPHEVLGQAVQAEIILRDGAEVSERDIKAHCHAHLEDFKVPQIVRFVSSLPKTQGGKIRRVP